MSTPSGNIKTLKAMGIIKKLIELGVRAQELENIAAMAEGFDKDKLSETEVNTKLLSAIEKFAIFRAGPAYSEMATNIGLIKKLDPKSRKAEIVQEINNLFAFAVTNLQAVKQAFGGMVILSSQERKELLANEINIALYALKTNSSIDQARGNFTQTSIRPMILRAKITDKQMQEITKEAQILAHQHARSVSVGGVGAHPERKVPPIIHSPVAASDSVKDLKPKGP